MKKSILWVEDQALSDLQELAAPVIMDANYDLEVACSATEAERLIRDKAYQVVVVDIRIPPGLDPRWSRLYRESGEDKIQARLGLHLLRALLIEGSQEREIFSGWPAWVEAGRFGILTVETEYELRPDLGNIKVAYAQKKAGAGADILIRVIEQVLAKPVHTDRKDE